MTKRIQSRQIQVRGIVSFPQIFQPQMKERKDRATGATTHVPIYSLDLLLPPGSPHADELRKLAMEVAAAEWGQDTSKWPTFRYKAVRDQGEKAVDSEGKVRSGYVAGSFFINASSQFRPPVVDYPDCNEIIDPAVFYGGCEVLIQVNAYCYNYMGNVGVKFGLIAIQKVGEGTPFGMGGRPDPEKIFKKPGMADGTAAGAPSRNLL